LLIVTERVTNLIDIFRVAEDGYIEQRTRIPSNNRTPFAIVFGHHHIVAISESNESTPRAAVPHGGSVSTYRITDEDTLEPISKAVADNQSGTCWIRFTPNGRFAYAANAGSGSLSSYQVSRRGELSLQAVQAADTGTPRSVPVDLDITRDGRFLYVVSSLIGTVKGFRIEENGSLTPVASIDGFPTSMQGIVAR
jgi:6-phosphogluconolactonase (cycloisomerase 2 family)